MHRRHFLASGLSGAALVSLAKRARFPGLGHSRGRARPRRPHPGRSGTGWRQRRPQYRRPVPRMTPTLGLDPRFACAVIRS